MRSQYSRSIRKIRTDNRDKRSPATRDAPRPRECGRSAFVSSLGAQFHRAADKTRSAHWKRMEEDYLRQNEAAQKEVDRIKADTALWERRVWKLDHDRPSGGDEVLAG
jgi:hypothetical protein